MKYTPQRLKKDFTQFLVRQKLSKSTITYYVSDVRVFLRFVYQTSGDYELTPEAFESYEQFLKQGALPTKTINRKLSSLRTFTNHLLSEGYLKNNVMKKVKNNKREARPRTLYPNAQTVIILALFLIIILGGGFLLSTNSTRTQNQFIQVTDEVNIPPSLSTNSTDIPERLNTQNAREITIEDSPIDGLTNSGLIYGRHVIEAGKTQKSVYVSDMNPTTLVFVTPTSKIDTTYHVKEDSGFFTVFLSKPLETNATFNWVIILNQLPIDRVP